MISSQKKFQIKFPAPGRTFFKNADGILKLLVFQCSIQCYWPSVRHSTFSCCSSKLASVYLNSTCRKSLGQLSFPKSWFSQARGAHTDKNVLDQSQKPQFSVKTNIQYRICASSSKVFLIFFSSSIPGPDPFFSGYDRTSPRMECVTDVL